MSTGKLQKALREMIRNDCQGGMVDILDVAV
jgi:hypothetical protein